MSYTGMEMRNEVKDYCSGHGLSSSWARMDVS